MFYKKCKSIFITFLFTNLLIAGFVNFKKINNSSNGAVNSSPVFNKNTNGITQIATTHYSNIVEINNQLFVGVSYYENFSNIDYSEIYSSSDEGSNWQALNQTKIQNFEINSLSLFYDNQILSFGKTNSPTYLIYLNDVFNKDNISKKQNYFDNSALFTYLAGSLGENAGWNLKCIINNTYSQYKRYVFFSFSLNQNYFYQITANKRANAPYYSPLPLIFFTPNISDASKAPSPVFNETQMLAMLDAKTKTTDYGFAYFYSPQFQIKTSPTKATLTIYMYINIAYYLYSKNNSDNVLFKTCLVDIAFDQFYSNNNSANWNIEKTDAFWNYSNISCISLVNNNLIIAMYQPISGIKNNLRLNLYKTFPDNFEKFLIDASILQHIDFSTTDSFIISIISLNKQNDLLIITNNSIYTMSSDFQSYSSLNSLYTEKTNTTFFIDSFANLWISNNNQLLVGFVSNPISSFGYQYNYYHDSLKTLVSNNYFVFTSDSALENKLVVDGAEHDFIVDDKPYIFKIDNANKIFSVQIYKKNNACQNWSLWNKNSINTVNFFKTSPDYKINEYIGYLKEDANQKVNVLYVPYNNNFPEEVSVINLNFAQDELLNLNIANCYYQKIDPNSLQPISEKIYFSNSNQQIPANGFFRIVLTDTVNNQITYYLQNNYLDKPIISNTYKANETKKHILYALIFSLTGILIVVSGTSYVIYLRKKTIKKNQKL